MLELLDNGQSGGDDSHDGHHVCEREQEVAEEAVEAGGERSLDQPPPVNEVRGEGTEFVL